MEKYICTSCGYQGRPTKIGKVKIIKELVIWLLFRIVSVFNFLLKSCPKYNSCPKCGSGILSIFNISFPEYYSLYARIYTLAFLSLQRTSVLDKETQKLILTQLISCFKFIGNPVDLVLHEIDSFDQLTNQLLILSASEDFEIASLAIGALDRLSICSNSQKEKIIKQIANYITKHSKNKNEKRIIAVFGTKRLIELCDNEMIKLALFEKTKINPDLYIALNMPAKFFKIFELKQIFQNLVLANRFGFIDLVKYFDCKMPYGLKDYVSFLMICSLYYDLSDFRITREWLRVLERVGISKLYVDDLKDSLRFMYCIQDKNYKNIIEEFVKRNKSVIGDSPKEFLKKI
jgi:hypothetical protein